MLTTLRNTSKNVILKFVLGTLLTILMITFAMWGTEDLVGITKKQNTVVPANQRVFENTNHRTNQQNRLLKRW